MAERSLGPDEHALWERVTATVRALHRRSAPKADAPQLAKSESIPMTAAEPPPAARPPDIKLRPAAIGDTLDGSWDKRLRGGAVPPDATIDLHGHSLAAAHAALDDALARSIARGDRLLLVVTGHPPRADRAERRGAIRAAMPDWLAASSHASRIAAVRAAHPRHGGGGAIYVVLRRKR